MIEKVIGNVHDRYQKQRRDLKLDFDSNTMDMMGDIRNYGWRKGIPKALRRHNNHFIGSRGSGMADRYEEILVIGFNALLGGLVYLYGSNLSYYWLPKSEKT